MTLHRVIADLSTTEREREIYSRFGQAAAEAQMFERALAMVLTFRDSLSAASEGTITSVGTLVEHWSSKTAGMMAHSLRNRYGEVPDAYLKLWDDAIEQRNRLMHRYFVELVATLDLSDVQAVEDTVRITDLACDIFSTARKACEDVRAGTLANLERLVAERSND